MKCRIQTGNRLLLIEPDSCTRAQIKENLTFDNPKYLQAVKYSRWQNVRVPKTLKYYALTEEGILLPYGFDVSSFYDEFEYEDCYPENTEVEFPKFKFTLREAQQEAENEYLSKNNGFDKRKGLVVMNTGVGKTITALSIASKLNQRTLVLLHKNDLIRSWSKDYKDVFDTDEPIGLIQGKSRKIGRYVTLATVQTLYRMSEEELEQFTSLFGLVVGDECHRSSAPMFSVVDKFNSKYKLGLTATLERSDGLSHVIKLYFGEVCYKYEAKADDTNILPVDVYVREIPTKLDPIFNVKVIPEQYDSEGNIIAQEGLICKYVTSENIKTQSGQRHYSSIAGAPKKIDYSLANLDSEILSSTETQRKICDDIYKEYKNGESCVVFFKQKQFCTEYKELLMKRYNISEEKIGVYNGNNSDELNDEVLTRAEKGEIQITLTTYSKCSEGTNCKRWSVAFLCSSMKDGKVVEQAVGRVRRTEEGKSPRAKVYDYHFSYTAVFCNHLHNRLARYKKLDFTIYNKSMSIPRRQSPLSVDNHKKGKLMIRGKVSPNAHRLNSIFSKGF